MKIIMIACFLFGCLMGMAQKKTIYRTSVVEIRDSVKNGDTVLTYVFRLYNSRGLPYKDEKWQIRLHDPQYEKKVRAKLHELIH